MARYALIIGIAEYTGHFPSLETPVQNANAIADILDRYGDFSQVRRLPFRREAGQKDLGKVIRKPLPNEFLVRELQQFLQDAEGSDVLIYYSGHGFTKLDQLSQILEGYLAPSDCQVELNVAGQVTAEKNGISLYGLNALINQHTFNSLVVILDCCNSGAFLESGMVRRDVTAFGYQRDYYLITACRSASKAYEGEEYSLLTNALLKGLSPANAAPVSGRISGDRLFDVIGNELRNSRQEPIRMGWGRLITLVQYLPQPESAESVAHPFKAANPYMGLKPFEREQADYFFGRIQAVRALLDRLDENRFLAVIGPSGCGKSSLVKAGLLPELEGDRIPGSRAWQIESITPGQYSLQALTNALERHHADDKPVVLFVDQFEELFTLCPHEEEQRAFIKRLNDETNDPTKQTRIIIAMRGDFLDRCAKFQEAADLINSTAPTTYMVTPLTEAKLVAELEDSITRPAALHGVSFEPGLVSRIVDDVINQPGAMPLLQYALLQLWDTCISPDRPSRQLTLQSYEAIDGVKGALQRWADQFYTNLSPTDQTFVRELISELVQIGDGAEVTRRRASWERLRAIASQEQLDRIIGSLVYQRLLVADDQTVEVAHEALLSESKLIQGWIEENREGIRLQQRLEIYRREWQEHDRSENYLLDAGRLAAIDEWMEKKQPRLMPIDQEFIEKSRERRDQQFQAQLDQERRLREEAEGRAIAEIEKKLEAEARAEAEAEKALEAAARVRAERTGKRTLIIAGMLALSALSLGIIVQNRQSQIAQQQASIIGNLVGKAEQFLESRKEIEALEASIEALNKLNELGQNNQGDLHNIYNLISHINERNRLKVHESAIYAIDISPDGETIASGGLDRKISFWNTKNSIVLKPLQVHKGTIASVRFSRDGKLLGSVDLKGNIVLWDHSGKFLDSFYYGKQLFDISFDSQSKKLAASTNSGKILVFKLENFKLKLYKTLSLNKLRDDPIPIYGIDFHPKSEDILVSTGFRENCIIWDVEQGKPLKRLGSEKSEVFSVRFNSIGDKIVSSNLDGYLRVWSLDGNLLGEINDKKISVYYSEFSPDNQYIASTSSDETVRLWSVKDLTENRKPKEVSRPFREYKFGSSIVSGISFFPVRPNTQSGSSQFLATASDDGTIRAWDLFPASLAANRISNHELLEKSCKDLERYFQTSRKSKSNLTDRALSICTRK